MPSRHYKDTVKQIEGFGYEYDRTNSKQFEFYTRPGFPEVKVHQGIPEFAARKLCDELKKIHGERTSRDMSKRHVGVVKERQAAERERIAAEYLRHEEELARLLGERDRQLGGLGAVLTESEITRIARQIEQHEREMRELRRLMTEVPATNAHAGRQHAQHRS